MLEAVFGIFLNLLLFFIIGFWPTFWLSSSKDRFLNTFAIASAIGFAITSIVSTYLILMDFPVKDWGKVYVLVCILISVAIFLYYITNKRFEFKELILRETSLFWLISGFVITATILVLPMLLGGFQFTLFRGNATDSYNYMVMAEYLDRLPLSREYTSFIFETPQESQLYLLAKQLLGTRWTTSAVLAFSSRVANVPINQFEYSYSVLFFIMTVGPAFLLARKLRLSNLKALIIALIICAGYWAQFVLDTRAFSQINSIPLILALCCVLPFDALRLEGGLFKEPILLGILGASLIFSYPEIVPLCVLSLFVFVFVSFVKKILSFDFIRCLGDALIVLVLLCLPNIQFIVSFLFKQLMYAANTSNEWHKFYYPWLYSDPIVGFWGLSPFLILKQLLNAQTYSVMVEFMLTFVAAILSGIVLSSIVIVVLSKRLNLALLIAVSFLFATLIQFLFLFFEQQWWAAGKALAFGYPFFLLVVAALGWRKQTPNFPGILFRVINGCVWFLVIAQILLLGARSINTVTQKEYPNYMLHNGYYRHYDFDLSPLQESLNKLGPSEIWLLIQDPGYSDYINLVMGWDHHVFNFSDIVKQLDESNNKIKRKHIPDFLVLYKSQCEMTDQDVVANNSEIALVRYDQSKIICFDITNPNGMEIVNNQKFYWLSNEKTQIEIQSSYDGMVSMVGDFTMGPSLPEMTERKLMATSIINGRRLLLNFTIRPGRNMLEIPVSKGNNKFEFLVLDQPTADSLPSGDPRILLLGVQNIQIQFQKGSE